MQATLEMAEVDCLVPVQGNPHQAEAGDVDTGSLKSTEDKKYMEEICNKSLDFVLLLFSESLI